MSDISLTASMRSNLLQLQGTAKLMDMTQGRIATGKKVNSALDGPAAYFTAKGLTDKASDFATLKDSMGQSISAVQAADEAITAISTLVEQAKGLTASAKSATTTAEKTSLAAQYDDIRTQIDRLAGDATYNGTNLVTGRGTLTGGTFTDDSTVAEAAITGLTDFSRTATDTADGTYSVTMQQKVEGQTSVSSATTGRFTATTIDLDAAAGITDGDALTFVVDGTSVGTFTYTDAGTNTVGELIDAIGANLGEGFADVSASLSGNELVLTATDGKKLQLTGGAEILTQLGLTHQGYQTGTDVTTDLSAVGGYVNVWTEGYSRDSSTTVTVAVSGDDLVITDGTDSTTVAFADFATGGSTGSLVTATINDLTVNIAVTGTLTGLTDGNSTTVVKNLAAATAGTTDIVDNSTTVIAALSGVSALVPDGTSVAGDYSIEVQKNATQIATSFASTTVTHATSAGALTDGATVGTLVNGDAADIYVDGALVGTYTFSTADTITIAIDAITAFTDVTATHTATEGITLAATAGKVLEIRDATANTGTSTNSLSLALAGAEGLVNSATGTQAIDITAGLGITGSQVYAHVTGYSSDSSTNLAFEVSGTDLVVTDGTSSDSTVIALSSFNAAGVDTVTVGDLTVKLVTSTSGQSTNTAPVVADGVAAVAQDQRVTFAGTFAALDTDTRRITIDNVNYDYTQSVSGNGSIVQSDTITLVRGASDAGDIFQVTVNGTTVSYTATGGDSTSTLAADSVVAAINANATVAALVTATNVAGVITINADNAGTAIDLTTTPPAVLNINGGTANATFGGGTVQEATIDIDAAATATTDFVEVTLNSVTIRHTAAGAADADTVIAQGLVDAINASTDAAIQGIVTAARVGTIVTITADNAGQAFTDGGSAVNGNITVTDGTTDVANAVTAAVIVTANTIGDTTATQVATSFVALHGAAIDAAGFTVTDNTNGTIDFLSKTAGNAFTFTTEIFEGSGGTADATAVVAANQINVVATQTITVAGTIDAGDVFAATPNGGAAVSYTATSTDTVTTVAAALVAAVNADATNSAIVTATNTLGVITLTEDANGAVLTGTVATGTAASTSSFGATGTSTTAAAKNLATGLVTDGDARFKVSSSGATETVNITAAGGAVTASNVAWGNALTLTTDASALVAGDKSQFTIDDNTGQFQAVVTSNSATNKVNVSASSNTVVSSSNSAWGSTVGIKGDDSLMVAGQTSSVAVTSTGGKGENDVQVDFNQDATAFINVEAVDIQANGLGINTAVNNWATTSNIDAAIAELNAALTTLRSNAQNLSTNLSVIQTREDFTANYINALTEGSDKLILADGNEEAANMLMLQTRQQLGIQALSMASQSAQSVLSLFR